MTEPSRPDGPGEPDDTPNPDPTPPQALGLTSFTMDGRRAPALFVVGWLATLVGGGFVALRLFGVAGYPGLFLFYGGLALATVGLVLLGGSQAVERKAAGASYAGPSPMLVLLAVLAATQVAGLIVGLPLSLIGASIPRPVGDLIAVSLQALVVVGVIRLMVVGADALTWPDMGLLFNREEAVRGLATGATYVVPVIVATWALTFIVAQFVTAIPESPLPPTGNAGGALLHLLGGAVVAPFSEEVLFRGFALTAWSRLVGERGAIARTSIVFVLAHVLTVGGDTFSEAASQAVFAAVVRLPVAVALAWLFVRTKSLWAPIGLHAGYNAILIILSEVYLAR